MPYSPYPANDTPKGNRLWLDQMSRLLLRGGMNRKLEGRKKPSTTRIPRKTKVLEMGVKPAKTGKTPKKPEKTIKSHCLPPENQKKSTQKH